MLGQLERAQSAAETEDRQGWEAAKSDLAALREELNGYVRELHRRGRNGWTPFRAIGAVLRADDGGVPLIALSWPHSDVHDAGDWQRLVEAVEEAGEVLRRAGEAVRGPALAGIAQPEWSPVWQTRLLEAARDAATRLDELELAADAACRRSQARRLSQVADGLAAPGEPCGPAGRSGPSGCRLGPGRRSGGAARGPAGGQVAGRTPPQRPRRPDGRLATWGLRSST